MGHVCKAFFELNGGGCLLCTFSNFSINVCDKEVPPFDALPNVIYETLQVQVFVAIIQSFPLDKLNCETTSIAQYHTITLYNYIKLKEAPFYVDLSHIGPILLSN